MQSPLQAVVPQFDSDPLQPSVGRPLYPVPCPLSENNLTVAIGQSARDLLTSDHYGHKWLYQWPDVVRDTASRCCEKEVCSEQWT